MELSVIVTVASFNVHERVQETYFLRDFTTISEITQDTNGVIKSTSDFLGKPYFSLLMFFV